MTASAGRAFLVRVERVVLELAVEAHVVHPLEELAAVAADADLPAAPTHAGPAAVSGMHRHFPTGTRAVTPGPAGPPPGASTGGPANAALAVGSGATRGCRPPAERSQAGSGRQLICASMDDHVRLQ
jgi:hypothetical protein